MTQHTVLEQAAQWLKDADGIVVCAANGLSMAEGFAILRPSPWFDSRFSDFVRSTGSGLRCRVCRHHFPGPKSSPGSTADSSAGFTTTSRFHLSWIRCAPSAACTRPLC